jgi:hypothetical protein
MVVDEGVIRGEAEEQKRRSDQRKKGFSRVKMGA